MRSPPIKSGAGYGGVLAVSLADRAGKAVSGRRHQDEVHVVRHQAIGPTCHRRLSATLREEIAIERIVRVLEEDRGATVAPLRDMVREARRLSWARDDLALALSAGCRRA